MEDYAYYRSTTDSEPMAQSLLLDQRDTGNTGLLLVDRIAAFQLSIAPEDVPATADKWLLASNLQKAIRRGLTRSAVATATKLLTVDAPYVWRRLLVIAYEDVGFGDLQLCFDLLKTFRREALHRDIGPDRVAAYFADRLSQALKSRALCDGIAMLEFSVKRGQHERRCIRLTDDQLIAMACSADTPVMIRVAALRHICGYREVVNGSYRTGIPARPELMREVARRVELSEMTTTLFLSGQGVSESLNIPLPMVSQMVRATEVSEQKAKQVFKGKNGLQYCALDRHTRAGKRGFATLAREVKAVRKFFDRRPGLNAVAVLGVAVFIIEGSGLNRWLVFDGANSLRQTFERNFLEYVGIIGDDADELLAVVADSLSRLNQLRAKVME